MSENDKTSEVEEEGKGRGREREKERVRDSLRQKKESITFQ